MRPGDGEEGFHIVIKPKLPAQLFPVWPLKRSTSRARDRASCSAASRRTCHVQLVFPSCLASLEPRESVAYKMLHYFFNQFYPIYFILGYSYTAELLST